MKGRILLIDDNLNLTVLLSRALIQNGYDAISENNSLNAMETVRRVEPDLIVLDIMMPGKSGTEILGELGTDRRLSRIPVILLTALGPELENAGERFHCEVLNKPVDLEVLLKEIEIHLSAIEVLPS